MTVETPRRARGTSNTNERGSTYDRRKRRRWIMEWYASDVRGFVRCYRCGRLLFNPDDALVGLLGSPHERPPLPLTIDRIHPGKLGGQYTIDNIRPACGACNSGRRVS